MKKKTALLLFFSITITACGVIRTEGLTYRLIDFKKHKNAKVINEQVVPPQELPVKQEGTAYLEFFALGCAGTGGEGQKIVAHEMTQTVRAGADPSFVLYMGDNFYPFGVWWEKDPLWREAFEDVYYYPELQIPFYAVLGNHDYLRDPWAQVKYGKINDRWTMPSLYYKFQKKLEDGTTVDFFGLDTVALYRGEGAEQLQWLRTSLRESDADWKIVYGHHPIFSGDSHRDKEAIAMRPILLPVLLTGGVDLYMTAHAHNIEIPRPYDQTHFLISGASSRPRDVTWSNNTIYANASLGFSWLRLSKDEIKIMIIGEEQVLRYVHTIPARKPVAAAA